MADKVKQELLLTESDLSLYFPDVFDGSLSFSEYEDKKKHYLKITEAQLAKAEPLIRKDERERIIEEALETMSIYDTETKPNPYTVLWQALKGEGKG